MLISTLFFRREKLFCGVFSSVKWMEKLTIPNFQVKISAFSNEMKKITKIRHSIFHWILGEKTLLNYNFRPISNILELIFFPNLVIQTSYYLGGSRWWIFIREFCIFRQKILQFFATPKIIAIYIQPIYANICSSSPF